MKGGSILLRLSLLILVASALFAFQSTIMPLENVKADIGYNWCSDGDTEANRSNCSVHFDGGYRDTSNHCQGIYHYVCSPGYYDVYCDYDFGVSGSAADEYCGPLEY